MSNNTVRSTRQCRICGNPIPVISPNLSIEHRCGAPVANRWNCSSFHQTWREALYADVVCPELADDAAERESNDHAA